MSYAVLKAMPVALILALMSFSVRAEVCDSMDNMMMSYAAFNRAANATEASKALTQMRAAAVEAKAGIPMHLEDEPQNSPKRQLYQQEMDKLIIQIDKTKALAAKGDMVQAKAEGKKLMQLRNEGHKLFR